MYRCLISICWAVTYVFGVALNALAAPSGPLAQVIEGAKKEGTATIKLVAGFTPKSMNRLEKELKDKYGVDLKIKFTGATKMTTDVTDAIMEQKSGIAPSYDLLSFSNHISTANHAGVLENVDWKPLLMEGTNPVVVHDNPLMRGGIVYHTAYFGLMYNPEKIKADQVPRTLADLANPKWKDKGGIETVGGALLRWSLILGKEKTLVTLRAIMKNGAIHAPAVDLYNRFLLGEIWFCRLNSEFLGAARNKGVPAAWQSLDFADISEFAAVVRKGAVHPNAAKLIALYLASPAGAKLGMEEANYGTLYYPGNYEHDLRLQNQKQGIPEIFTERRTDVLEFYTSKEGRNLGKEIGLILQTGGGH